MKVGEIMKYKRLLIFISFLFIMFLSTNVNASDNVKIKSIELIDKSVNTTEVSKATFDGLVIDFDLKFISVDDYAKYKVIVENSESKDYKISVDSNFSNSKYITYEYEKTDNLKANSDTEFYVTVKYKNEVDNTDLVNGKYSENNSAVLHLSNDSVSNPLTSNNVIMIIIALVFISIILFVLFKTKNTKKINFIILFIVLLLPLFVKAVDSLKITVNSNVVIEKGYSVGYLVPGYIKASDASDYDFTHATCDSIAYVGSVSDENKYLGCDGLIYTGNKLYVPGETVSFDYSSMKIYLFMSGDCQENGQDEDGNYIDICKKAEEDNSNRYYEYAKSTLKYFGYKYNDNDNDIMKFSNASDDWQDEGSIFVYDGSIFTMPNHDVLFSFAIN